MSRAKVGMVAVWLRGEKEYEGRVDSLRKSGFYVVWANSGRRIFYPDAFIERGWIALYDVSASAS